MTATEPGNTALGQTVLATIDPNSDVLVASPAVVQYEIAAGTTCAPNCSSPAQSGDPSPLPDPPPQGGIRGGARSIVGYVLMGVIPVTIGLCFFFFLTWGGPVDGGQPPDSAMRVVYKIRRAFSLWFRS